MEVNIIDEPEKMTGSMNQHQKIDKVYDLWATKHKLTLYEMMMFYEIFQKENRKHTERVKYETGST